MKVIHLILGKANPERMNGVNKVVHALATQQSRAGWDVAVWGITRDPTENFPPREFSTRLFPTGITRFHLHPDLVGSLTLLGDAQDVVVHLHGGFIPAYCAVGRLLNNLGVAYIITPHGSYNGPAMRKSHLAKQFYLRLCEQYLLRHASLVHCLGQSEVQGVAALNPALPTCLLPYGFEAAPLPPARPATPGIFRVGFCGRLDEQSKALNCLIAGFASFAEQMPATELWIIGDGPDRQRVEHWASLVPTARIKVLGSQYGPDKLALLTQLDAFAHPSNYEGLPTAVLEASALGIPCVVTEATNLGSYIRQFECGQVLAEAQPDQLAAGLQRLHEQWVSGPGQLRQRCHDMVETAFSWTLLLQDYQRMYRRACHV